MAVRTIFGVIFFAISVFADAAPAATLSEDGGNYSDIWAAPTVVASGTTTVTGGNALGADRTDVLQFSGLRPGASAITFDFAVAGNYRSGGYANGGGTLYYSFVPFTGGYYITPSSAATAAQERLYNSTFGVTYDPWDAANPASQGTSRFTLALGDSFAGSLFVALDTTYGNVSYAISGLTYPSSAPPDSPSPMPLSAGGLFMLMGLTGLAVIGIRRRRS